MGYAVADEVVGRVRAAVFAAREVLAPDEWIERHWVVQTGERKGSPMDLSRTPHLRKIARAFAEPGVTDIVVVGPAQSGKTELIFGVIAWSLDQRPSTWMVMLPKAKKAEDNNVDRFLPSIEANERTRAMLAGKDQTRSLVRFKGGATHWIGSESLSGAEGTPAENVWTDEFDRCDETGRKKIEQRGKTFARKKRLKTGTPGMSGEGIDAAYASCDVRWTWHVPCPHCLKYYTRVWSKLTVVWEGGHDAPPEDVRRNAWYACPHCAGKSLAKDRAWQASLGVWLAQTQTIGPVQRIKDPALESGATRDEPGIVSGKVAAGQQWGFAFTGLDNELEINPVGEVAAAFLREVRAHGRPGHVWTTETLGVAEVVRSRRVDIEHLKARASAGTHVRGLAPRDTVTIVGAMDVQTDRVLWLTAALGPRMQDVYLLDWGEVKGVETEGKLEREVRGLLAKKYPVVGGLPIDVRMLAVDTGHRATEVYGVKVRVGTRMKLVKGDANRDGKNKDLFRLTQTAVEQVSPLKLLLINVTPWKTAAANLLMRPVAGKSEAKGGAVGGEDEGLEETGMAIHLPRDAAAGEAGGAGGLLEQLCSERYVVSGSGGLWQLVREGLANHWWDCLIYVLASAVYYRARVITRRIDAPSALEMNHGEEQGRTEREPGRVGGGGGGGGGGAVGGLRGSLTGF